MRLYLNPIDEQFYLKDETGFICGIGKTAEEAIETAEFWGFNCKNIECEE